MKILVASVRAELLPLAHRLRREGHEVQALVWRPGYEAAWGGAIEKVARHSDGSLELRLLDPKLREADRVVTTVRKIQEQAPSAYGVRSTERAPDANLLLGGWFDGEGVRAPHLLIADWGAWPGGSGPRVLGGLLLVRLGEATEAGGPPTLPGFVQGAVQQALERMKSASFRGLFHLDVEEDVTSGELRLRGLVCGWPWLHTQAWLAELGSLGAVLEGGPPQLGRRFVCVLPISVPPWPNERQGKIAKLEIGGLTPEQQGRLFWFDMEVDGRRLRTAGIDGLVAVATGAADSTPSLARARALELAGRIELEGKQWRPDVGAGVDAMLGMLEDRFGFVA